MALPRGSSFQQNLNPNSINSIMDLNISIEDAFQNASEHVNNPRGKPRGIIRISSTGRSYVKLDILPFCLGS